MTLPVRAEPEFSESVPVSLAVIGKIAQLRQPLRSRGGLTGLSNGRRRGYTLFFPQRALALPSLQTGNYAAVPYAGLREAINGFSGWPVALTTLSNAVRSAHKAPCEQCDWFVAKPSAKSSGGNA
jgi:hypothetical protein